MFSYATGSVSGLYTGSPVTEVTAQIEKSASRVAAVCEETRVTQFHVCKSSGRNFRTASVNQPEVPDRTRDFRQFGE